MTLLFPSNPGTDVTNSEVVSYVPCDTEGGRIHAAAAAVAGETGGRFPSSLVSWMERE